MHGSEFIALSGGRSDRCSCDDAEGAIEASVLVESLISHIASQC